MARTRLYQSLRITVVGMVANALLALGKFITGWLGHSQALVADAVESMADVISGLVVIRGIQVAAEPADKEHPYGHGKAEPLAAALVAGLLFVASLGIGYHAIRGLFESREAPELFTLWVLVVVVVIKEILYRLARRQSQSLENQAILADAWHHRSDAITSCAAILGICLAIWGGKDWVKADNIAAILAACIIAFNGWRILWLNMNELMDVAAAPEVIDHIRNLAHQVPEVKAVEKCIVRKAGYRYLVDMHIEVEPSMTVQTAHRVAHHVKDVIVRDMEKVADVLVHIEPADPDPQP